MSSDAIGWLFISIVLFALLAFSEISNERATRAARADSLLAEREWRLERAQLIDRIQSGDITQYHALQAAYVAEQGEAEVRDWNHDEFGFVSEPRLPDPQG